MLNDQLPELPVPDKLSHADKAAFLLPGFDELAIRYSPRRKRIGIRLTADGSCELLAPAGTAQTELKKAYEFFKPWVKRKLEHLQKEPETLFKFRFEPGGEFFFRGQKYILTISDRPRSGIILEDGKLLTPPGAPAKIRLMLEHFYRREAEKYITQQLEWQLPRLGLSIEGFSINSARRRFGSCSNRRRFNFSWHLMMYPDELIELVILHEAAHLTEMNHSPGFYRVLSSYLPDHRIRQQKLNMWSRMLAGYEK